MISYIKAFSASRLPMIRPVAHYNLELSSLLKIESWNSLLLMKNCLSGVSDYNVAAMLDN